MDIAESVQSSKALKDRSEISKVNMILRLL